MDNTYEGRYLAERVRVWVATALLKLKEAGGAEGNADLLAGFFGVGQNATDYALFPIISWALVKKAETSILGDYLNVSTIGV